MLRIWLGRDSLGDGESVMRDCDDSFRSAAARVYGQYVLQLFCGHVGEQVGNGQFHVARS